MLAIIPYIVTPLVTYKGQAYLFSPSSKSGLVDFWRALIRLGQVLMSRLMSSRGSKVSDVFKQARHLTGGDDNGTIKGFYINDYSTTTLPSFASPHTYSPWLL